MSQSEDKETHTEKEEVPIERKLHLLDLPYDVMEMVLDKMELHHQRFLRGASKELEELHTRYAMHTYEWYVDSCAHQELPMESVRQRRERIALLIVDNTLRYYLQEGFETEFASNLLHFQYQTSLRRKPKTSLLYDFIYRFQQSVEDVPLAGIDGSRNEVPDHRLIYTMSLFGILRQFDNFCVVESVMHLMHWQLVMELPNVFVGVLHERKVNPRTSNRNKRISFVAILVELLYSVKMNKSFGGFKDTGNVAYSYGFQCDFLPKRKPSLVIKCNVLAPKSVLLLLQDVITGKDVSKKPIRMPPGAVFRARLQVYNKPVYRFFDYGTMHINICQPDELF